MSTQRDLIPPSPWRIRICKVAVLFCLLFSVLWADKAAATDGLRSFLKVAPPLVEPNVLFFLDSSGSMLWPMDAGADERNPENSTFGDGTLGWQQPDKHAFLQEYYGRDLDASNNDPNDPDHYHPELVWKRGGAVKADDNDSLMPNDSRGYKAKLVLWRILGDKDLVSGLRIAFATYMQSFYTYQSGNWQTNWFADWYRYPHSKVFLRKNSDASPGGVYPSSPSNALDVLNRYKKDDAGSFLDPLPYTDPSGAGYHNSWRLASGVLIATNEDSKRALLRSDFRSYVDEGVLDETLLRNKILKWIDGKEIYTQSQLSASAYHLGNPEIRFDGWRPLRESFFARDKTANLSGTDKEGIREGSFADFFKMTNPATITHYCQDNWVVLLTSGGQSYGTDDQLVQSVKDLYNTSIKISGNNYSRPIRTIVLAFVDPESEDENVAALRNKLNRVADAGDNGVEDNSAKAYFATDVPGIMGAMNKIIATIRAASGTNNAPLPSPASSAPQEDVFYQPFYIGRADAHWRGDLKKTLFDGNTYPLIWSAANKLQSTNWDARKVYIPALVLETDPLRGLTPAHENLARFSTGIAADLAPVIGISGNNATTLTSNFIQWYLGDNIYLESQRYKLFDMYYSGVAKIGPPDARSRIGEASYSTFVSTYRDRPTLIFTQSNAGLLHAFNDEDGTERWAFMPPNALVKGRLRGLKGMWDGNTWKYDTTKKSYSRYITDGPIMAANVEIDGEYRTVILGLLGLGGAGMYALDITDADMPRFLWAVENDIHVDNARNLLTVKQQDIKGQNDKKIRIWKQSSNMVEEISILHKGLSDTSVWNYSNLRFTLSVPRIGFVTLDSPDGPVKEWVFVMGNGTPYGESFSTGEVYVGKITTGEIIKRFTAPQGVNAGFFVSPISVVFEDSRREIKTFFAADSKTGTVFMGDTTSTNPAEWTFKKVFTISTLPGVGSGNIGFAYTLRFEKIAGDNWLFAASGDWLDLQGGQASTTNYFVAVNLKDLQEPHGTLTKLDPTDPLEIAPNNNGWFIEFGQYERLSSPPVLYNGYVFFATFTQGSDPCNPESGTAKLYAVKGTTGEGAWTDDAKVMTFPDLRISGVSFMKGKMLLGSTAFEGNEPPLPFDVPDKVQANSGDGSIPAGTEIEGLPGPVPGSKEMLPFFWKGR